MGKWESLSWGKEHQTQKLTPCVLCPHKAQKELRRKCPHCTLQLEVAETVLSEEQMQQQVVPV